MFLLGEFLWAAGNALFSGAEEAIVYDSLKKLKREKDSKKIFARMATFQHLGFLLSAPIGSFIAAKLGLQYPMMFMMIPMLLAFIVAIFLKEPVTTKKVESTRYVKLLFSGIKYLRKHKVLRILAFDRIFVSALVFFILWIVPKIKRHGWEGWFASEFAFFFFYAIAKFIKHIDIHP